MGLTAGVRLAQILDLLAEDSWTNVYAGELEVRPPGAPTTKPDKEGWEAQVLVSTGRLLRSNREGARFYR